MKRFSTFLIALALIAGLVGCGEVTPSARYSLAMAVVPSGGGNAVDLISASPYAAGTSVSIKAVASSGYHFVNWAAPTGTFANVNGAQTTFTMPTQNVTATANFVRVYDLAMVANPVGEGTATDLTNASPYTAGTSVNIRAVANTGYRFANWTGDVDTIADVNAASTTITMNGDYSITANFKEDEVVTFVDANLEASVRRAIAKPDGPIYTQNMERLTSLDAELSGISDLTGLEYATCLTHLGLWDNQISNLSSLANLTNLTVLWIGHNQISDISALANLTKLTSLGLWCNQICDISPLTTLTNLTYLNLHTNQIKDISPLTNLTGLTHLNLNYNQISDISPLVNLTRLTGLFIWGAETSDLLFLANLSNLRELDVTINSMTDIAALLPNLTKLTALGLSVKQITDAELPRLVELTNLRRVDFGGNQISDISPLANLTNLTEIILWGNRIANISPLANLINLTTLSLDWNRINDISPLVNLTNLSWLSLTGNQITSVSPLANITSLWLLRLGANQISDISPLVNLNKLWQCDLHSNRISDVLPLVQNAGMGAGDRVWLDDNPLSSDSINRCIPELQARGVTVDY